MLKRLKSIVVGRLQKPPSQEKYNLVNEFTESEFRTKRRMKVFSHTMLLGALVMSIVVLFGYAEKIQPLFRFSDTSPSINPLTAQLTMYLSVVAILMEKYYRIGRLVWLALASVLLFMVSLYVDYFLGTDLSSSLSLFQDVVEEQRLAGFTNKTALNTLLMCTAYVASLVGFKLRKTEFAHGAAFIGLLFPFVSFSGYLAGIDVFHGAMSHMTVIIGFLLGTGLLCKHARFGLMRILTSDDTAGYLIRRLCIAALIFPLLAIALLGLGTDESVFSQTLRWLVMSTAWFSIFLLVLGGILLNERASGFKKVINQLDFEATHDMLTGLYNRRYFNHVAVQLVSSNKQNTESNLWAAMVDIDHFKEVNDTHGHLVGDKVLKELAQRLQNSLRSADVVCRWGGEEFLVLLRHTDEHAISAVMNKIKAAIESSAFIIDDSLSLLIQVSIGVTKLDNTDSLIGLINRADEALYKAKETRNAVVFL